MKHGSPPHPDPSHLFQVTEQQARQYPVHAIRLPGKSGKLLGLALLHKDRAPGEIERAVADLAARIGQWPEAAGAGGRETAGRGGPCPGLPNRDSFVKLLEAEMDRVQESRLPCSLLMLEIEARARPETPARHCADTLWEIVGPPDVAGRLDTCLFSVALPGTSLGKALRRADHIRQTLQARVPRNSGKQPFSVAGIGVGICHATQRLSAEDFLEKTAQALAQAHRQGRGAVCHGPSATAESACQVTVEERAQLFRLLTKDYP